jgi:hypothetical protein
MKGKLLFALAGAAAMYFADPQQGSARRARVRDRLESARRTYDRRVEQARGGTPSPTDTAQTGAMVDLTQANDAASRAAASPTSTATTPQQASPVTSS